MPTQTPPEYWCSNHFMQFVSWQKFDADRQCWWCCQRVSGSIVHEGCCHLTGYQSDSDIIGVMSDNCAADAIESKGGGGGGQSESELDINYWKVSFNSASNLVVPISINGVPVKAIFDTAAQISVINTNFIEEHLPCLKFSGAYSLNGIGAYAPLCASMSEGLEISLGDRVFMWKVIRLSENTLSIDSVIPMEVKTVRPFKSYTVNTVSLFKKI